MHSACPDAYPDPMSHLQIRNVPEDVHRRLRECAAMAGMSLSEYALTELTKVARRPTRGELLDRIARRPPAGAGEPAEISVRGERDSR